MLYLLRRANERRKTLGSTTAQRSGVEWREEDPAVVLYETALRSLSRAKQCIVDGDQIGRVMEVKKVTNTFTNLQARIRTELGRGTAVSLSDFYAAMFTLTLEASQCESTEGLDEVIGYVSRVRDAWTLSKSGPKNGAVLHQGARPNPMRAAAMFLQA